MIKKRTPRDDGVLVYSSGPGGSTSFGPGGKKKDESGSAASFDAVPGDQKLRVIVGKGAKGKTVTTIRGLVLTQKSLDDLSRKLKQKLGAGGTVDGATIVIQGDQGERAKVCLAELGYGLGA